MHTCEDQYQVFSEVMNYLIDQFLPMKIVKQNSNDYPWITPDFRELIAIRQYHFHNNNKVEFSIYRNAVNRERKALKIRYYGKKMSDLKSSSKSWWSDVKEITGQNSTSQPLLNMANTQCDGDMNSLAEKINSAFSDVALHMVPLTPTNDEQSFDVPSKYIIPPHLTQKRLASIKVSKAMGPDGIPNRVLQENSVLLAEPVCALWISS